MQSVGADRHLPFAICWQQRKMVPYVWQCNFKVWKRTQLLNDGSYHLVLVRTVSFLFFSQPPQTLHGPGFPPLLPPWVPTMGLMSWHLPLCANVSFYPHSCPCPCLYPPYIPPFFFFFSLQLLQPLTPSLFLPEYTTSLTCPLLHRHTQQTLSHKCQGELYSPFIWRPNTERFLWFQAGTCLA